VALGVVLYQRTRFVYVIVQSKGRECTRTLMVPMVVGLEIESIETSSEPGEGAPAVERVMNTDDGRLGVGDAPLGDGEPRD
jgi:hypothetical protein